MNSTTNINIAVNPDSYGTILHKGRKYKIHIKYKDMPVYSSEAYYHSIEEFLSQNKEMKFAYHSRKVLLTRSLNETSS